jgi:phosphatidate phosphatase APP1
MPELFASLSSTLVVSNTQPLFMYLSSSPIQLYEHLQPFVRSRFPAGPVVLRNYTFTNIHAFIRDVQLPTREYKMAELRKMRQWYPKKKFLLIGDSTQEDPEAYGAAFRELGPDWVGCIWIRKVEGSENDDARFQAAFAGVPRQRWRVFNSPVADRLGEIRVASGSC